MHVLLLVRDKELGRVNSKIGPVLKIDKIDKMYGKIASFKTV